MNKNAIAYAGTMALVASLALVGCGSNSPDTGGGSGGSTATTGSGGSTATTGSGGSTATTGSGGSTATTGSGGSSGGSFTPLCTAVPNTAAGVAVAKGGVCVASDPQLCFKTCGPGSIGFKSETCMGGAYVEQSTCSFATGADYACYKIPATMSASCPTTIPQANMLCTVAPCTPCNMGGNYLDTSSMSKAGYCVCPQPGSSGTSKWSCASATAWPCPGGAGC